MFVKKLVEKATDIIIKPAGNSESLRPESINPRLAFHYGVPYGGAMLAHDPLQNIVAISTKNGQIKLLGKGNTQALLESKCTQPSMFLQFIHNQGILLHVTLKNQIEVWDINRKVLVHIHDFEEEITSFIALQQCLFIFVGDAAGKVTVWKLNRDSLDLEKMKYCIPFSASLGTNDEAATSSAVIYTLPQPSAESKRILLIYADGSMVLWAIPESKVIFTTGGSTTQLPSHEAKKATSACWACPYGSKVAIGYSTGDIFIYTIPSNSHPGSNSPKKADSLQTDNAHIFKLNLGYRLEKVPIATLKWVYSDGKGSRLYVMGASDATLANSLQVILLNEETESRTIKQAPLELPEPCLDMEIISCSNGQSKHKQGLVLLLGKSGRMYACDDHLIEKHLSQSQSKSSSSIRIESMIKLPFSDSNTTAAQYITNNANNMGSVDKDYMMIARNTPSLLPSEGKHSDSPRFTGFSNIKNLYITGHSDGTIKFWDLSIPIPIPLLSLTQQSEDDSSHSGVEVTAIYYCTESRLLFSGDKNGMVRIYQFKPEPFAADSSFFSLPGSLKKGSNHVTQSVKVIKVSGCVLSFNMKSNSRHLAVGSEQGHVSVIDIEGPSLLYQKQVGTELSSDVISLQFESCDFHSFEKHMLVVATKDSSVLTFEADTGNTMSNGAVHPKKPCRALFMQILGGNNNIASIVSDISDGTEANKGALTDNAAQKQLILLVCSEKAVYIYSLPHVAQGIKKVWYKKKFHSSSCCWASTFCSATGAGLILLFSCGKIEIRSLPELSLVKETDCRSFTCFSSKLNSLSDCFICSSADGEIIMARNDQEIAAVSTLLQNEIYRNLDSMSQVYDEKLMASDDGFSSPTFHQKEKKKGIFGSVFKDTTGGKTSQGTDTGKEDVRAGFENLSTIFSIPNFPDEVEVTGNTSLDNDADNLDIDDIDLDEVDEKPKGHSVMTMLNKQKLANKFQSFKGKWKQMTVKTEKPSASEEPQSEKTGAVDQIKKKYGFSSSTEAIVAKIAEAKLTENVKKLEGINLKTTEMQDSAQSFSSMAKETLRIAEQKNGASKN